MKKILFICDGDNFPKGAFHLIELLQQVEPVFVKSIFFAPVDYEQMISVSYMPIAEPFVKLKEDEKRRVQQSKNEFTRLCEGLRIKYSVHENEDEWDKNLFVKESRFADLVLVSEELFCSNILHTQPNYFMQEALHGAECPVLVVPESFRNIDRIAIAYDGKRESMFALKQFSYLFPQLSELPAEFIYINNDKNEVIPDNDLLMEYTRMHFNSISASKLHFDPKKYLNAWLSDKKNVLLITGSYSRSAVSNMLNHSFTDNVIQEHSTPVFIAHF
jgi:hypothetical protein